MVNMPFVFLSYAHEDSDFVDALEVDLQTNFGIEIAIWRDKSGIRTGTNWVHSIADTLHKSVAFIVIVSPFYGRSGFCQQELFYAVAARKPIIPIYMMPPGQASLILPTLANMQGIEVYKKDAQGTPITIETNDNDGNALVNLP